MELAAVLIAGGALVVSVLSYLRARKADHRAEARGERRETREEREAAARRQGKPVVVPTGISGGPTADPVHHNYEVSNGGAATITELWLWIEAPNGNPVSSRAGGHVAMTPGSPPAKMGVDVRQPLPEVEQTLWVEWSDADGTHRESTGLHPPRSA